MSEQAMSRSEVSRTALWFGLLGGAVAWLLHLLLVYTISEWGCVQWSSEFDLLGITVTAWLLIVTSAATLLMAAWAAWTGYRSEKRLRSGGEPAGNADPRQTDVFSARTGLLLSGLFAFIILVESVPTFYFLQGCGGGK